MNWEPMTEDAVFEYGETYLLYSRIDERMVGEYGRDGYFHDGQYRYSPSAITHFARITNPNEEKP